MDERELTNEELEGEPLTIEKVPLDGGGFVYSRDMGGTARDLWEQRTQYQLKKCGEKGYPYFRASLVAITLCDKDGKLRYSGSPEDVKKVAGFGAKKLDKLYSVGARLSGVTKEDAKQLGEGLTASEDSISDSPGT